MEPGESSPIPAGCLGFMTRGHRGHWREGSHTILERRELIENSSNWNETLQHPCTPLSQEYCEPGMYSSRKTGRLFFEKTNIFKGKKKSNAISIWKISLMKWPDLYLVPLCWSLPVAKFCQSTRDSALLILRQSLLERQRWKQTQTGKEIWRKQIMLKI